MPQFPQNQWQEINYSVIKSIIESFGIAYSHYTGNNDDHHAFGIPIKLYIHLVSLNAHSYPPGSIKVIVQENNLNTNNFIQGNNWYGNPSRHIFVQQNDEFKSYSNLIAILNSII